MSTQEALDPEELWTAIVLQGEAIQVRLREFHQQVETFIELTGENPLTGEEQRATARADGVPLRERTTVAMSSPLVSDAMAALAREVCDEHGRLRDVSMMTAFIKRIQHDVGGLDDKVQVLFILDISFRASTARDASLSAVFEKERGYEVISNWFAEACTYQDEASKSFSQLLLGFLMQHKPVMSFARKVVLTELKKLQSFAVGRRTKALIKETLDKYRE